MWRSRFLLYKKLLPQKPQTEVDEEGMSDVEGFEEKDKSSAVDDLDERSSSSLISSEIGITLWK